MTWRGASKEATRRDAMQEITDAVIAQLEQGVKPWIKPWDSSKCAGPFAPFNPVSRWNYHGSNFLILAMHPLALSGDPRWMTFVQAKGRGWNVKQGSKSTTIFYTKTLGGDIPEDEREQDETERTQRVRFLKTFHVFHASQVEGIPTYEPPTVDECPWRSDEATDIIMRNAGVPVRIGGDRAFYSPDGDFIQMPPSVAFNSAADESCVRLHELTHATGAKHRLDRDLSGKFGSKTYSFEELVAEISSMFTGTTLNLPIEIPNHANYIGHWLEILKGDKHALFRAAAQAQKAADWILNLHPEYAANAQPDRPRAPQDSQPETQPRPAT